MNEFKIGDEVYYFWHANDCSLIWDLNDLIIEKSFVTKINKYGNPCFDDGYEFFINQPFYKTKNEAINAMIKKLESMRND